MPASLYFDEAKIAGRIDASNYCGTKVRHIISLPRGGQPRTVTGPIRTWSSVTFSNLPGIANVKPERRKAGSNHLMANSVKSSFQLKILYGEGDSQVLVSQAAAVQQAGHQVEMAVGRKAIVEAANQGAFDLVILGPTLTRNDRHHLPYVIKKAQAAARVLVMHTDGERHPAVDANLDTGRSIADLVAKIASMMTSGQIARSGLAKGAAAGK